MKRGLFVGRFQPFHLGHLKDIKKALEEVDELAIGIGSSNEENTKQNPFSAEERAEMISAALKKQGIKNYRIFNIPDFHDDKKWIEHIEENLPKWSIAYTGNEWTERCFRARGHAIKKVKIIEDISSTIIRDRIINNKDWQSLVPKEIADFISKAKGIERVKKICKKKPREGIEPPPYALRKRRSLAL